MNWLEYPENTPTEPGYYMTFYWHEDDQMNYYKAIFWSSTKNDWLKWRASLPDLNVKKYLPESRDDYYMPCMEKFEKMIGDK